MLLMNIGGLETVAKATKVLKVDRPVGLCRKSDML